MKATQQLHGLGQSIWLDNITRGLHNSGVPGRYLYGVTWEIARCIDTRKIISRLERLCRNACPPEVP
jgi:hypothetical protein